MLFPLWKNKTQKLEILNLNNKKLKIHNRSDNNYCVFIESKTTSEGRLRHLLLHQLKLNISCRQPTHGPGYVISEAQCCYIQSFQVTIAPAKGQGLGVLNMLIKIPIQDIWSPTIRHSCPVLGLLWFLLITTWAVDGSG